MDRLTSASNNVAGNYKRVYKLAKPQVTKCDNNAILSGSIDAELIRTVKAVVAAEEPISEQFLVERVLAQYGISKYGVRLEGKIISLIPAAGLKSAQLLGATHYYRTDKAVAFERYRVEEGAYVRTVETDYSPYDVIALVKAVLLENVSLYRDELISAVIAQLKPLRGGEKFSSYVSACIDEGTESGMFIRSVSDRISLG